ncbi:MAG: hypothetical protein ACD_65C00050G0002 [uncultured bacterium]|nr:MAG: hypothetical protein ACD_65C00050G0002 [uncultured bacterium]
MVTTFAASNITLHAKNEKFTATNAITNFGSIVLRAMLPSPPRPVTL